MVVNCQNVELWFKDTGEMKVARHNPRHLLTNQVGCEYDAQATCPTWDAAIRKVFKSCVDPEDVIRHFEEVMGYILQPTRHQAVWVMLKGPGGNGKSFLLAVMSSLMGAQTVIGASIAEMAQGVSPHFTDSLQGKLMLLDDDQKAKTLLPDDWLKKLSEAKLITANPKFGRPYNFTARSIPVILTNSWPSTVDLSDGLRRRALVFESNHVLTQDEKDPKHFRQIVDRELPGVLNRFVAGFRRFLVRGQRFDIPAECRASSEDWLALSNPTAQFARQALETTDDRRDHVPASRIYDAYFNWVRHWEHGIRVLGRYQFYEALAKLGYRRVNHHNVVVFSGIRLRATEGLEGMFFDGDPNQGL
jgi:P4 family phage/plasmid primase-like protien